jgi:Arc/MetJ-type ribon-helix-helix transcriptional regulator
MDNIDLDVPAELFTGKGYRGKSQPVAYRRFPSASEAIRFAVEELPDDVLARTVLEVDEARFDATEIKRLYQRKDS